MIVAVFAMFGVGYYVGMQYSDNKTTVSLVDNNMLSKVLLSPECPLCPFLYELL